MSGYVQTPKGWRRVSNRGPGPFVTTEVYRAPDGREVRWRSRAHRRGSGARGDPGHEPVWWRPHRRNWWMAVLYALGSLCFTAGGILAQWSSTSRPGIGVTFFVGSLFFTSAAYLQYSETVNVDRHIDAGQRSSRWRPASWEPHRIDWLAAVVLLVGTVFFNVTTFTAMNTDLTTHQVARRVWAPDALGCIAFLISSELSYAEVCQRWLCWRPRPRSLAWTIVALNLLGSLAFAVSAVASYVEPSTGEPISTRITNAGTSLGGLCFLIASLALMPEAAHEEQARLRSPVAGAPAAAR